VYYKYVVGVVVIYSLVHFLDLTKY
jgi:hypothetical protein